MKNVDLIEVTLEDLGGVPPTAGTEIVLWNVRYRIIEARPPKDRTQKWRSRQPKDQQRKWSLLVQKVNDSTLG